MFGRLLFALILPAGGETAPDMPLGFILLQNLLHLKRQPPIKGREPSDRSLWTVDLLMPNFLAAERTVPRLSMT